MMRTTLAATLLALAAGCRGDIINDEWAEWSQRGSQDDLWRFVSRPDLTPPKLAVNYYRRDRVAPGYIFVAPYDCLECSHTPTTEYVTQQIGPHIYTQDGELVWSGIDLFPDKKVFDFRPVMIDGDYHLACITPQDADWHPYSDGAGMILDSSYEMVHTFTPETVGNRIDLHEFNIIEDGKTVLMAVKEARDPTPEDPGNWKGKIMESFVLELDLKTQEQRFVWKASDHVSLLESTNPPPKPGEKQKHWDWFHLNSIDKDDKGNYLVSARATNTIFLISPEGEIIWRLGGLQSDFTQDFNFSRQHHARIRKQGKQSMTITFFDNAADDSGSYEPTSPESSLKIVALNYATMTATLNHRHPRPDGGHSEAKGNVEYLSNGGVLGGWGENAYFSEYAKPGGEMVYEAQFASRRFANYRTYKMPFVGNPKTKPDAKSFVATNSRGEMGTNIFVSWNGATEVAVWNFYARAEKGSASVLLGSTHKTGFETAYRAAGFHPIVFVEAVDVLGNSLANSTLKVTELPFEFHDPKAPLDLEIGRSNSALYQSLTMPTLVAFIAGFGLAFVGRNVHMSRNSLLRRTTMQRWVRKEKS